ncbi:MAG TPA: hypothetical protein VGE52_01795 [Pirellulales bacterium]
MATLRGVAEEWDHFNRAQAFTTTPGHNGWTIKKTGAGTPTHLIASGREAKITLSNTSEAQIVTLYHNDVLNYPLKMLQNISFSAKCAAVDAVTTIVMGLASAQNDTPDSVATHAWFRLEGSASLTNIVAESDDGSTDRDDKATGATLASTWKRFFIDFAEGLADVRFYIDGERVASDVKFDLSAIADGTLVQPYFMLGKASGTGVPSLSITGLRTQFKYAY